MRRSDGDKRFVEDARKAVLGHGEGIAREKGWSKAPPATSRPACRTATSASRRRRSTTGPWSSAIWWSSSPKGESVEGERAPSSEKALHLACYEAFPEVGSVIHSHPVYATMFAVARVPIPACIDEFTVYVGGEVAVTEYAPSGTTRSGEHAVKCLADRGAALTG